jgi:hypothetical protein
VLYAHIEKIRKGTNKNSKRLIPKALSGQSFSSIGTKTIPFFNISEGIKNIINIPINIPTINIPSNNNPLSRKCDRCIVKGSIKITNINNIKKNAIG